MKYQDIINRSGRQRAAPATHPYIAEVVIDPADRHRFVSLNQNHPETVIIDEDQSAPNRWTIMVACASESVKDRLESAWY